MLTQADFVVLTKTDMVSQAELEIISSKISELNPKAALFPVDGLAGYGADRLAQWLLEQPSNCGSEKTNFAIPCRAVSAPIVWENAG